MRVSMCECLGKKGNNKYILFNCFPFFTKFFQLPALNTGGRRARMYEFKRNIKGQECMNENMND